MNKEKNDEFIIHGTNIAPFVKEFFFRIGIISSVLLIGYYMKKYGGAKIGLNFYKIF